MFIMAYNDYVAVKLVTATRPNLGFYSRTPAPPLLVSLKTKTGGISSGCTGMRMKRIKHTLMDSTHVISWKVLPGIINTSSRVLARPLSDFFFRRGMCCTR